MKLKLIDCIPKLSFYEFLKQACHVSEPNVPFVDNWYMKSVAKHIEVSCNPKKPKKKVLHLLTK
jgi:hypothetical protein